MLTRQSIFDEPSAHGVTQIAAEADAHSGAAYLTLKLTGLTSILERPTYGEISIYGRPDMGEKFAKLAKAINEIFEVEEEDA